MVTRGLGDVLYCHRPLGLISLNLEVDTGEMLLSTLEGPILCLKPVRLFVKPRSVSEDVVAGLAVDLLLLGVKRRPPAALYEGVTAEALLSLNTETVANSGVVGLLNLLFCDLIKTSSLKV